MKVVAFTRSGPGVIETTSPPPLEVSMFDATVAFRRRGRGVTVEPYPLTDVSGSDADIPDVQAPAVCCARVPAGVRAVARMGTSAALA